MVTVYPPPALREVQPDWASKTAGADVVVRGAHFRPAAGLALRARRGRECCLAEDAFITVSFSREAFNVNIFYSDVTDSQVARNRREETPTR